MDKYKKILPIIVIAFVGLGIFSLVNNQKPVSVDQAATPTPIALGVINGVSYNGRNGIDALTLLKENSQVELDNVGMVTSINGQKADNSKKEFWAFYVNGKMAEVGSADYKTVDSDVLNWKIEKY